MSSTFFISRFFKTLQLPIHHEEKGKVVVVTWLR